MSSRPTTTQDLLPLAPRLHLRIPATTTRPTTTRTTLLPDRLEGRRIVTNWNTFVRELNDMFGNRHRSHTAQQALRSLCMVDSNPVNGYVVEFTCWANMTGFDNMALTSDF